ncbi:hypothetical protein GCM10023231_29450 [Olivibacter ginsenosidimutans]|uniref:Uncharacterized protein n=2 Tax=Olivibacter ginsenosidimutans TaxID=1176537 RepID=A0ABP9BT07_9SPHI
MKLQQLKNIIVVLINGLFLMINCLIFSGCQDERIDTKQVSTSNQTIPLETFAIPVNGMVKIKFTVTGKYVGVLENYNGAEALKDGVGTHEVYDVVDAGDGYVGFLSQKNGQFLKAAASGNHYLYANGGSQCDSDWERFLPEEQINGSFAFKCKGNSKYLNVENIVNMPVRAFADAVNTWETFEMKQVVDMWKVMTAFADHFPTKSKYYGVGTAVNWIKYTDEQRNGSYLWQFELFGTDSRYPGNEHPTWNPYSLTWIGDWEVLMSYGTQPKYSPADNPASAWSIPRCLRYLEPTSSVSPSISKNRYTLNLSTCTKTNLGVVTEFGSNSDGYLLDLSNVNSQENMGTRWVINLHYKTGEEYFVYDLGPSIGVFSPLYGIVGYHNGIGPWVHYSNIQDKPLHDDIYCLSGIGD